MMAVVSGESEGPSDDEDIFHAAESDDEEVDATTNQDVTAIPQGDGFLYDENLDEEDEAYVNQHLRGGQQKSSKNAKSETANSIQKPRNSDAVLSCPCCFRILSLDTQKHAKYSNQFRAMFVMGISVDWQHLLKYDDKVQGLVRYYPTTQTSSDSSATQVVAPDHAVNENDDPIYYAVSCANCQTMVAALDMTDEVYHFYDCLAST